MKLKVSLGELAIIIEALEEKMSRVKTVSDRVVEKLGKDYPAGGVRDATYACSRDEFEEEMKPIQDILSKARTKQIYYLGGNDV